MQREITNLYDVTIRDFNHHKLEIKNLYTKKCVLNAILMALKSNPMYIKSIYIKRQTRRKKNAKNL